MVGSCTVWLSFSLPPFSFFLSSFGVAMSEGKNEASWEELQVCSVSKTQTHGSFGLTDLIPWWVGKP